MSGSSYSLAVPLAHGTPPLRAVFKQSPLDFQVEECLPFEPTGQGEHYLLQIRKRGLNTQDVVRKIARCARLSERWVSFAGLKDKQAVTTQWFSVQLPIKSSTDWAALNSADIDVVQAIRHDRKLRRGAVASNRFDITLRDVVGDAEALIARLQQITAQGVPNYYGPQRFGRNAQNLSQAESLFAGTINPSRFERGMYLSAARAWLFNQVLAHRVAHHTWNHPLPGDVFWLQGTKRFFSNEAITDVIQQRLAALDIHPTGPLWGQGELPTQHQARAMEVALMNNFSGLAKGLEAFGLQQDRRPLRVVPLNLHHSSDESMQLLRLQFELPAGAYATGVLRELAVIDAVMPETASEDS
ncbi:MAG: tRNA pseudouridine(13) synthase TruD [Gammaproteobacteria bacterium]|nr:tRNA pseudouridine(13) synthase TruD [Gammaproteobacteria bacterium]